MKYWYQKNLLAITFWPLSLLFQLIVVLRQYCYRVGLLKSSKLPIPVIVIGNLTVGGTGKTPLVIYLVKMLKTKGYRVGVISRGYGGSYTNHTEIVTAKSDPGFVGDEPVLIASAAACPVVVGRYRMQAAERLLKTNKLDIILSDDGLQHYALARDAEICVIDGQRRFGNTLCLPAGPLREPLRRLKTVDFIVANGKAQKGEHLMQLVMQTSVNLSDQTHQPVSAFQYQLVHAVAGIGNPQRFFQQLREQGLEIIEHAFPDHHAYQENDLLFDEDLPILMTSKDAIKCRKFAKKNYWEVLVSADLPSDFVKQLDAVITSVVN